MAQTLSILGQAKPAAATPADLVTVAAAKTAAISVIVACNQASTPDSIRVWCAIDGAVTTGAQYVAYDVPIQGNQTIELGRGITLGDTDVIRVQSASGGVSFNAFGAVNG